MKRGFIIRPGLLAGLGLLLGACTGCWRDRERTVVHLAPLVEPPYREEQLNVGSDWRPGLTPVRHRERRLARELVVPATAMVPVKIELPPLAAGFRRKARVVTVGAEDGVVVRWESAGADPRPKEPVEVHFSPEEVGRTLRLAYRWVDKPKEPVPPLRTRKLTIPSDVELSLSIAATREPAGRFLVDFEATDGAHERVLDVRGASQGHAWIDASAGLANLAGRSGRFVFSHEGPAGTEPLWGNPVVQRAAAAPARRANRPSFVLVSLDTLRADRMSLYGSERRTTPRLEARLGRGGIVLERALAQASMTLPSHMTLFTSLMPCAHQQYAWSIDPRLPPGLELLAEVLRDAGYRTVAVTEDGFVGNRFSFPLGFDRFVEFNRRGESATHPVAAETFALARRLLSGFREDAPFLLFVHTYQVHEPYLPPPGYVERLTGKEQDAATPMLDLYDAEILYLDELLDGLLEVAETAPQHDHTYFVIFSDHGEEFFEHGAHGHGQSLYEELIRVPLIVRGPGVWNGRMAGQWGLIDVAPTLLEVAGLPPWSQARGQSFARLLRGEPVERTAPLFGELPGRTVQGIFQGSHKTLYRPAQDKFEILDLASDPRELAATAPTGDGLAAARSAIDEFAQGCAGSSEALKRRARERQDPERDVEWSSPGSGFEDAGGDQQRKLKELGYVD
jgi:arylsulfatase A-like enzyme